MLPPAHYVAEKGERLVYNLLPGSVWLNENYEHRTDYKNRWDIEWKGITIEVKTRSMVADSSTTCFNFNHGKQQAQVLVYVGFENEKYYIWAKINDYRHFFWGNPKNSIKTSLTDVISNMFDIKEIS